MKFQDLAVFTDIDVRSALLRDDPAELRLLSITVALGGDERKTAQSICINLSSHPDCRVRGNAVMSLGYLARRFRQLDEEAVKPVIEGALRDPDLYVRLHAKSSADEIHQFLHWEIAGHIYGEINEEEHERPY